MIRTFASYQLLNAVKAVFEPPSKWLGPLLPDPTLVIIRYHGVDDVVVPRSPSPATELDYPEPVVVAAVLDRVLKHASDQCREVLVDSVLTDTGLHPRGTRMLLMWLASPRSELANHWQIRVCTYF